MVHWMKLMIRCGRTRSGVPLLVHWSVPAIALFVLGVEVRHIALAAIGIASYLAIVVIHEAGHQLVAERRGCRVFSIEIHPIHAVCRYEHPGSAYDTALIAWGGVAAQFIVAAPIVIGVNLFGYTPFGPLNLVLAILGFLSPVLALVNLMPIGRLDGKAAWTLLPLAWSRLRRPKHDVTPLEALEEALRNARPR